MVQDKKIKWSIDPVHSQVEFKIKHLMVATISGKFKEFESSIYTTGEDFMTAEIDFWVNPASIDSGNLERDEHLKSDEFFDVDHFKEINFQGNTYEELDKDGSFNIYGDMTLKGVKRQVKLQAEFGGIVKDPWGNEKAVFTLNGKINRADWDLVWNKTLETGGVLIGDDVWVTARLQLVKQS